MGVVMALYPQCVYISGRKIYLKSKFERTFKTFLPGPVSISDKTSYCKISQSLEGARFVYNIEGSLWNSTALLPRNLSNVKAMRQSCGFEVSRNPMVRRLIGHWDVAQHHRDVYWAANSEFLWEGNLGSAGSEYMRPQGTGCHSPCRVVFEE